MHQHAQHAPAEPAQQVQEQERRPPEQRLRQGAERPQAPHVERQMEDAEVEERGGEEPPRLTAQGARSKVRPPAQQGLSRRGDHGNAGYAGRDEYGHVETHEEAGDDRPGLGRERRGRHRLWCLPPLGYLARWSGGACSSGRCIAT